MPERSGGGEGAVVVVVTGGGFDLDAAWRVVGVEAGSGWRNRRWRWSPWTGGTLPGREPPLAVILPEQQAAAFRGGQVVIQRYDKPVAVLVNYEAWQEWQAWKQQRRAYLDKLSAEVDAGRYFTQEQVEQGLRERGLID